MKLLSSLADVIDTFEVAVLDQWGVMHNGAEPYSGAAGAMEMLHRAGKKIVVVSNSGKRSELNLQRIERIGLPAQWIDQVVTSGETLWEDLAAGSVVVGGTIIRSLYAITGKPGDAERWASGNVKISLSASLSSQVDAILLMGLPDGATETQFHSVLEKGIELGRPMICSNPDKTSPRSGGLVLSPGALADRYEQMGGTVVWYGKPHSNIYRAVVKRFPNVEPKRFLMVGDSLEHDIQGAQAMGMSCALVCGGIHANEFDLKATPNEIIAAAQRIVTRDETRPPDYLIRQLA